jgi:hypothetical protein
MRMKVTTALSPTSAILCTLGGIRDSSSSVSHATQMAIDRSPGFALQDVSLASYPRDGSGEKDCSLIGGDSR